MNRFILISCFVSLACVLYTANGQTPCENVNQCIARQFCRNPINTVCRSDFCFCTEFTGPQPETSTNIPNPNYPSDISTCVDDLQCQTRCRNNNACCDAQRRCQCVGQCYPQPPTGAGK